MTELPGTINADANGNAMLELSMNKASVQWHVWQITVETIPARSSARATIRRNGRYLTSTILGSNDSAQGPPALLMNESDKVTIEWTGMTLGDECIGTLWYEEVPWGMPGTGFGLV